MKKSTKKLIGLLIFFAIIYGVFWTLSYDSLISLNFSVFDDMTFLLERVMPILSIAMGIIGSLLSIHLIWLFLITFIYNLGTYAFVTILTNQAAPGEMNQILQSIISFIPAVLFYLVLMMVAFTIIDGMKHVYKKRKAVLAKDLDSSLELTENETISIEDTALNTEDTMVDLTKEIDED